jgi:hypothetical protein
MRVYVRNLGGTPIILDVVQVSDLPVPGQIPGTATNDDAAPGNVGEYVQCLVPAASATVTISQASPAVVSWTAHGRSIGGAVNFTTTGALPTPLTVGTTYYISSQNFTANSFCLSTSVANALAGVSINTSSAGSGVHTGRGGVENVTNVVVDIAGISLTAGDWDVWTNTFFVMNASTVITAGIGCFSLTSATLDTTMLRAGILSIPAAGFTGGGTSGNVSVTAGPARLSLATTTTVFFVGFATFTTSTLRMYGGIAARRVR